MVRYQEKGAEDPESERLITHIIFDVDGTLLDTERIYTEATEQLCERFHRAHLFDKKVNQQTIGRPNMEVAKILKRECKLPVTPEVVRKELDSLIKDKLRDAELKPGAAELVEHFFEEGIPMAIATSSRKKNALKKMSAHPQVFEKIPHKVFGNEPEIQAGKPAPDIFLAAATRFDEPPLSPENVLVFEDSPHGVNAALAAGMNVVFVPDPSLQIPEDVKKDADLVVDSLEDFQPEMFGLPPM